MGRLAYDAMIQRDLPLVLGWTTCNAILVLLGGLLADALHAAIDPRIRQQTPGGIPAGATCVDFPSGARLLRTGTWMLAALASAALAGPWLVAADPDAQLDPPSPAGSRGSSFSVIQLTDGSTLLADHVRRTGDQLIVDRLGSQQRSRPRE